MEREIVYHVTMSTIGLHGQIGDGDVFSKSSLSLDEAMESIRAALNASPVLIEDEDREGYPAAFDLTIEKNFGA